MLKLLMNTLEHYIAGSFVIAVEIGIVCEELVLEFVYQRVVKPIRVPGRENMPTIFLAVLAICVTTAALSISPDHVRILTAVDAGPS